MHQRKLHTCVDSKFTIQINMFGILFALSLLCFVPQTVCMNVGIEIMQVGLNLPKFVKDLELPNKIITTISPSAVLICVKYCLLSPACLSVNFDTETLQCQLNSVDDSSVSLVNKTGGIYSSRRNWMNNLEEFGTCASSNCLPTEACVEVNGRLLCVLDACGEPRILDWAVLKSINSNKIHGQSIYVCKNNSYLPEAPLVSYCLSNGTWTEPTNTCKLPENCVDIKSCNSTYTNGEYWVYPAAVDRGPVKVYCNGMDTASPTNFITLKRPNEAFYAFIEQSNCQQRQRTWPKSGLTRYLKVGVNLQDMTVIDDDFSFTTTTRTYKVKYGWAESCSLLHSCPPLGTTRLDLSETGLIFSNQTTWETFGWASVLGHVTYVSDHVIEGACDGYGGGCKPTTPLRFKVDPDYTPEVNTATMAICA